MKRTILGALILAFVFVIAFIVVGCLSNPPKTEAGKIPPLPQEVALLRAEFGEPKMVEAFAVVLIWEIDGNRYHVLLIYDPFIGEWLVYYYPYDGVSSPRAVY